MLNEKHGLKLGGFMKNRNIINIKSLSSIPLLLILAVPVYAGNLSVRGVSVLDMAGIPRATFTNTERIILRQKVYNQASSQNMVTFKFIIYDPAQTAVFLHSGNAAPGSIGQAQTQVSGIPISQFYKSPGAYRLVAKATLDGETVIQEVSFSVSSPNIILTYPPNGVRNLVDNPLIFRWVSSGASRYRLTVGENPAVYNPIFQQENNGESYFTYPQIVAEQWQNLEPGKTYYWKVDGLDSSGNTVAESGEPSNFSIKLQAASQSRNVAVISLEMGDADADGLIPFSVIVKNQGGSTETGISVKFTLGGMPASDSPKQIPTLMPGGQASLNFKAFIPQDHEQSLAVVCIDTFDDVPADNCKSKLVSRSSAYGGTGGPGRTLTYEELWEIIKEQLGPELAAALEGYSLDTIICENCQGSELGDFISSLIGGESQIVWSDIPRFKKPPTVVARAGVPGSLSGEAPAMLARKRDKLLKEWAGRTVAFPSEKAGTFIIRGTKEWKKFWARLASKKAPKVDFSEFMAIGIVAGKNDKASDARILQAQDEALALVVTYYVIEVSEKRELEDQAYRIKLVKRTDKDVEFREIK